MTVIDSQPARFPIALCSFWLTADRADIALLFRHTLILVKVDPLFGLKSQVARSVTLTFIERFSSLISTLISPRIRRLNRRIANYFEIGRVQVPVQLYLACHVLNYSLRPKALTLQQITIQ